MGISPCNQVTRRIMTVLLTALILVSVFMGEVAYAGNTPSKKDTDKDKIHVSAETLMVDSEARYAEFTGNVRATQGNTVITAGTLKIFYQQTSGSKGKFAEAEGAIEKIVAERHVKIKLDDKVAVTEQAVYTTKDRILVLSGPNSKITSQKDSISGSEITFYRADGRIKVEGGQGKPVEAVFYPGESGIK